MSHSETTSTAFYTKEPTWVYENTIDVGFDPWATLFLILADRAYHVDTEIMPKLRGGKNVICDRYYDSCVAYQGEETKSLFGSPMYTLANLHRGWAPNPDLTILLDVKPKIAIERIKARNPAHDPDSSLQKFLKKVRKNYLRLAEAYPDRIRIVNANKPTDYVFRKSFKLIQETINNKKSL